jgi:hypothetical protein
MSSLASQPHLFKPEEMRANSPLRLVIDALSDDKWDFRTIDGISKQTGLTQEEVIKALNLLVPNHARRSPVRDDKGRSLYTLKSRKMSAAERASFIRLLLTKSR